MKHAAMMLLAAFLVTTLLSIATVTAGNDVPFLSYLTALQNPPNEPKLQHYTSVLEQASKDNKDSEITTFITAYALPELCYFGPGIVCRDWQLKGEELTLTLYNSYVDIVVMDIAVEDDIRCTNYSGPAVLRMGETKSFVLGGCSIGGSSATISLVYKKDFAGSFEHTLQGRLLAKA